LAQQAWIDASGELGRTLRRLETLAVRPPEEHGSGSVDELTRLQHALHRLAERYASHPDLSAALESARDATGELVETAAGSGWRAAAPLVYEWRGALFRVRLARLRALERTPLPAAEAPFERLDARHEPSASALVATALVIVGALVFTAGAVLAAWPLWAAGLALFGGGFVLFRP
jgi:hypothetical protein